VTVSDPCLFRIIWGGGPVAPFFDTSHPLGSLPLPGSSTDQGSLACRKGERVSDLIPYINNNDILRQRITHVQLVTCRDGLAPGSRTGIAGFATSRRERARCAIARLARRGGA